jgi:PmbA protein
MEPYVVIRFLSLLIHSLQADSIQKGKSTLTDQLGNKIASRQVNLIDDPLSPEGAASFPFDGEGVAAQRVNLIEQGILKGFLYDTYTGLKDGHCTNGHGERGSFRSLPGVGATNLILSPGIKTPEDLIKEANYGFYVTDVMGMHTANPISGDFSVGAAGIMIEQGQLSYPVRGVTIAGNLFTMLKDIESVGSDLRFYGGKAASTVLIKNLSIAGS